MVVDHAAGDSDRVEERGRVDIHVARAGGRIADGDRAETVLWCIGVDLKCPCTAADSNRRVRALRLDHQCCGPAECAVQVGLIGRHCQESTASVDGRPTSHVETTCGTRTESGERELGFCCQRVSCRHDSAVGLNRDAKRLVLTAEINRGLTTRAERRVKTAVRVEATNRHIVGIKTANHDNLAVGLQCDRTGAFERRRIGIRGVAAEGLNDDSSRSERVVQCSVNGVACQANIQAIAYVTDSHDLFVGLQG